MWKTISILWHYGRTNWIKRMGANAFRTWQQKKLKQHLRFVRKHSPYFRQLPLANSEELTSYPYMDKQVMMTHFSELNTLGVQKEDAFHVAVRSEEERNFAPTIGGVTVGLSSGTSGNRGMFLVSEQEQAAWAGTILAKLLPNGFRSNEKIAFFLRANSNLYEAVQRRKIQFAYFDLFEPFEQHVERLQSYQPTIIAAPPSMMRKIAGEVAAGRLHIKPVKILTMAEVLDPLDEQWIASVFKQKVHQVYQCTEGFLGCTCEHGTLHINEDIVYIEKQFLNNEKTKFYPIVTDFRRKAQPIIRYRLNDILTIKQDACPCGSPMLAIEQIEGRMDDLFIFLSKEKQPTHVFPDFIRRACIVASGEILEYRVIQHAIDDVEVQCLLASEEKRSAVESQIRESFHRLFHETYECPCLRFTSYEEPIASLKLKRIENRMPDKERYVHV